jgi:tRNA 2-thiouridine synthesizing protein C
MNTETRKSQLIVIRRAPYGNSLARASLDAALAAAVFDQAVELLFLGEGVLQLLPAQDSTAVGARNVAKLLGSLPLYDIEAVYVDATALARFAISSDDLLQEVKLLNEAEIHQLMSQHDHVMGF